MDVDQSLRGSGVWRCPALHIPRSFELQSPDLDQSNPYIEKEIIKIQKKASPETIEKRVVPLEILSHCHVSNSY